MILHPSARCEECGALLFSGFYRELKRCPDCLGELEDLGSPLDLEDRLAEALKP